ASKRDYQQYVVDVEMPKDRIVNFVGIGIYYLFGILDFLTFDARLTEVLILRWAVVGPLAIAIVAMSLHPRLKRQYMIGTASLMVLGAFSIIAMIAMAPMDGAPPYIMASLRSSSCSPACSACVLASRRQSTSRHSSPGR
ncbi:MAG: hypothetical protein HC869_10920, partial [Rhodospirillales bacterium]|nr:hypothetical protein [Rhodospirillales bacterium]